MIIVTEFLAKNKSDIKGNIMLIFQPAEEGPPEVEGGGAKMMLEEGIFFDVYTYTVIESYLYQLKHSYRTIISKQNKT